MDLNDFRLAFQSDRPPLQLKGFTRNYQTMRVAVNIMIPPTAFLIGDRLGGPRDVLVGAISVLSLLVLIHEVLFPKSSLPVKVSFDTITYIAIGVLLDLPEVGLMVAVTQSFLLFLHVKPKTAIRLVAVYASVGVLAAFIGTFVDIQQRTHEAVAAILAIIAVFTLLPAVWMLSQAAADILRERYHREALSREKDELLADKDKFVASVSHELRTPLTAVVGMAHTLAETPDLTDQERSEFIATIVAQSEEVAAIVDDLLVTARANSGHLALVVGDVMLRRELDAVIPDGFPIEDGAAELMTVGDPIRVRQILRNLISNADRYGGATKRVRLLREGLTAVVEVIDDGEPIPPDQIEGIFTPYGRAHDRPGRTDSVGLGLTVSRQLARMMRGDVTYSHDGTWARFRLTLPISVAETAQAMAGSPNLAMAAHRIGPHPT
jgi:signal transduction histidine kinase